MTKEELKEKAVSASYPPPTKAGNRVLHTLVEEHPVRLSDDELRQADGELRKQFDEWHNHKAHAKQVKADLAAREAAILANMSALSMKSKTGTKNTPVQLMVETNYEDGTVVTRRQDTGEVLRSRPLRQEDRQGAIDFQPEQSEEALALPAGSTPEDTEPDHGEDLDDEEMEDSDAG